MASNAKIGLLLGLVVIFVIMFVINGRFGFNGARDHDDLPPTVVINPPGIKPDIQPEAFPPVRVPERRPEETPPPENKEQFQSQPSETTTPDETDNYTEPARQAWPKVHIVNKGDNLADIAKKWKKAIEKQTLRGYLRLIAKHLNRPIRFIPVRSSLYRRFGPQIQARTALKASFLIRCSKR